MNTLIKKTSYFRNSLVYKKLPGFTLLELLFVILLTSIVVSLTFTYFTAFRKYMSEISKDSEYETEIMRFETFLRFDIEKSEFLAMDQNSDYSLKCDGTNIYYYFGEEFVIRTMDQSDDTLFAREIKFNPEFYPENDTLVVSFNLNITDLNNRIREYWFYKNYPIKTKFDIHFNKTMNQ